MIPAQYWARAPGPGPAPPVPWAEPESQYYWWRISNIKSIFIAPDVASQSAFLVPTIGGRRNSDNLKKPFKRIILKKTIDRAGVFTVYIFDFCWVCECDFVKVVWWLCQIFNFSLFREAFKKKYLLFSRKYNKKPFNFKIFFPIHFPFKIIQKIGEMSKKNFPKNWKNRSSIFFFYI